MIKFILKRILFAGLTVWLVASFTFFLIHNIPGDPFKTKKALPPQVIANLDEKYGLDKPLAVQYVIYMGNLIRLDFGISMVYTGTSVNSIISRTFPVSADLGIRAFIVVVVLGLSMGTLAAVYHRKAFDKAALVIAIIGVSIPGFIFGTLVQYFLCFKLSGFIQHVTGTDYRILPVSGWDGFRYTIAPTIALAFGAVGVIIRMMRASMLDVMGQDYIVTAQAKGLDKKEIVVRHVLRNAVLPVVSVLGSLAAAIIMGSFVIENIFSVPGLGSYFVTSIQAKDYTMVTGLSVFTVFLLVCINTVTDIVYALIDPRIRLAGVKD